MMVEILTSYCQFCNAEIDGKDEIDVQDKLLEHYQFVKCLQGY